MELHAAPLQGALLQHCQQQSPASCWQSCHCCHCWRCWRCWHCSCPAAPLPEALPQAAGLRHLLLLLALQLLALQLLALQALRAEQLQW
jgi:hypothetical protein